MDADQKKTALRMIPYGLYVLTAEGSDDRVAAAAVNWVTQASFDPPLVAVGIKADSGAHSLVKETGHFALNMLGKGQKDTCFSFFKPTTKEGDTLNGEKYKAGANGCPILESAAAFVECKLVETVEKGDHSVFVAEVIDAAVQGEIEGRPDNAILLMQDLGEKTFYGG